jgi:hypothetical protein
MASNKGAKESRKTFAAIQAGEAYRNAMPLLAGYEGVRDFIACTSSRHPHRRHRGRYKRKTPLRRTGRPQHTPLRAQAI